jgi:hypothetical protein
MGIGGDRLHYNQLSQAELDELANKAPILTYGPLKQAPLAEFVPAHVAFDKKVSSGILRAPLDFRSETCPVLPGDHRIPLRENCSDASAFSHRHLN